MKDFLSNKKLQTLYAGLILLLLFCAAPIISGPRGFGVSMYSILGEGVFANVAVYLVFNILIAVLFLLLPVPAVFGGVSEKVKAIIRLAGICLLAFVMLITLLSIWRLAWGWGLWLIVILTILLFVNVLLNNKDLLGKA
ncbi:MAG: hypothetical protein LIO68_04460 [Rikenellaceae bacterium]|nr:hypothetical protein [Rikenellaceae bacterium]